MNPNNLSNFNAFLLTPPLWHGNFDGLEQFDFPNLDLEHFQMDVIPENIRLGHQIEHVFLQLIEYSKRYKVRAYNIPIRRDKISLGEIDFILEDFKENRLLHVELTYKFYLMDPTIINPIHQLIGPNKRDTFFSKKEKIKNHQIPLVYSLEGHRVLQDLDINTEVLEHRVCFKGQIFIPLGLKNHNLHPLNNQCIAGFWMTKEIFLGSYKNNTQLYMPQKKEWPQNPTQDINWQSYEDVLENIDAQLAQKNSPMVWLKLSNGEFLKVFIVWWL